MPDVENVIRSLETAVKNFERYSGDEYGREYDYARVEVETLKDVIALLKAQEQPTSESISSAIECLLHPQDADDSDMAKAIDTAVRAMRLLKAQGPVKPKWQKGYAYCGQCGYKLHWIVDLNNFCPNCGQAVKWE
jgi:hypothetical protein